MTCFRTNTKNISWKMCYSWFRLYFFCPSVLAIQKTYRKNASDFYLGKRKLQTSLEVSYKNFANNGLYWLQFLNLWCAMTKHNSSFLFKVFAVLKYIYKYIQVFFFFTFSESVIVGIVYKDLHDVLITDQPLRTITGATRWGYLLQFLN